MSSQFAVFIEPSKAPYYERIVLVNGIIPGHQYYSTYPPENDGITFDV